jgi:rhodanese-related sulfurtransferase
MREIDVHELYKKLNEDLTIIDIREAHELRSGAVPGVVNIPMMTFALNHEDYVDKSKDIYIICEHGVRSVALIDVMESLYDNLINVTGGTEYYARYYPLEEYKKGERHGH